MTDDQRQRVVDALLRDDPTRSDRSIASDASVTHNYVAKRRRELVRTGKLASPSKRQMSDGRMRTAAVHEPAATYAGGLASVVKAIWGLR